MSVLDLIRPELLKRKSYSSLSYQFKHRLHANELPWSALTMDLDLNYYPKLRLQKQLNEQLADRYQIQSKQIVLTRGSDDGIDLIMRLFLRAGKDACMLFPPTFSMYSFFIELQQAQVIECPLDAQNNFNFSIKNVHDYWQKNCKIIMLCSPNNPTGNIIDLHSIASLCERYRNQSVIVVDEAYIEFTRKQSATCLIEQFDNLIILRTLSKAYGLANLRLGAILAQSKLIEAFHKIMNPYPISDVVIHLALKAIAKNEWVSQTIIRINEERIRMIKELESFSFIQKVYASETNFILIKVDNMPHLVSWISTKGIAIKSFPTSLSLQDHLRITIGNEQQNQLLLDSLATFNLDSAVES